MAKAHADVVLISGHDGGTGASPLSSIKHAGGPWELGLAEAHQTLVLNNLRSRILCGSRRPVENRPRRGDRRVAWRGGIWFATAPLVTLGCIMMRVCHLNTCPVGVATQDPRLRKRFTAIQHTVVEFHALHRHGTSRNHGKTRFRKLEDMVGRTDKLFPWKAIEHWKANGLDLTRFCISRKWAQTSGVFASSNRITAWKNPWT